MGKFKFYRKGKSWLEVTLESCGVTLVFRKPRQSVLATLRASTPIWSMAIREQVAYRALSDEEKQAFTATTHVVPPEELDAMAFYLTACTLRIIGVEDGEGHPVRWEELDTEERDDFYMTLPDQDVQRLWGQLAAQLALDNDPALLERLAGTAH